MVKVLLVGYFLFFASNCIAYYFPAFAFLFTCNLHIFKVRVNRFLLGYLVLSGIMVKKNYVVCYKKNKINFTSESKYFLNRYSEIVREGTLLS